MELHAQGVPLPVSFRGVEMDAPEGWPAEEVLLGTALLDQFGVGDPLQAIATRMQGQTVELPSGLDACPEVESDHVRHTSGTTLESMLPLTTGSEPDELDRDTALPQIERKLTPGNDPLLQEAITDMLERTLAQMDAAVEVMAKPPSKFEKAQAKARWKEMVATYGQSVFRVRFYKGDQPCDVAPWVDPVISTRTQQRKRKAFRRRYTPQQTQFMRELVAELKEADMVVPFGDIKDEKEVWAIANAVCTPKKGADKLRMAFDMRELNELLQYINIPAPTAAELVEIFSGKQLFLSFDLFKAFWQLPLSEQSRRLYTLATADELIMPTRVIMGAKNSMAALAKAVREILGDLIDEGSIGVYADDGAGGSATLNGMLDLIEKVFTRCAQRRLFISPTKLKVFETRLPFLGKIASNGGLIPDPKMLDGASAMSRPFTVSDIMTFKGIVGWLATHLPHLREVMAPIQALETKMMAGATRRTKGVAARMVLGDEWTDECQQAFDEVKRLLVEHAENYLPQHTDRLALFTDASRLAWSGVLMAFDESQLAQAVDKRDYRVVSWVGGCFKRAEISYSVPEKEVLAVVRSTDKLELHLHGAHIFELHVDHKNMVTCWELGHATDEDTNHVVSGRVQRWAAWMTRFNAAVFHVDGAKNFAADYGSRNRLDMPEPTLPYCHEDAQRAAAGQLERAAEDVRAVEDFDFTWADAATSAIHDENFHYPDLKEIGAAQDRALASEGAHGQGAAGVTDRIVSTGTETYTINGNPAERHTTAGVLMVSIKRKRRVWIPGDNESLKACIAVIAHAAIAGHQGSVATRAEVRARFYWKGMSKDVDEYCRSCLNCWSAHRGETIPRPLNPTYVAQWVGQCTQMDFVKMVDEGRTAGRKNRGGRPGNIYEYMLVIKDKFSRKVMLRPCERATAQEAARCLLEWFPSIGIPEVLYTDGGPHFTGRVMNHMVQMMGLDRVFSVPYAAWTNGSVERAAGSAVSVCMSLCSENKVAEEEWYRMLPLVEYAANSKKMECLGNRSPLEVCTGSAPRVPLDIVLDGLEPEDKVIKYDTQALDSTQMDQFMRALRDDQLEAGAHSERRLALDRARKNKNHGEHLRLQPGDYVMAHRTKVGSSKLTPTWDGPHQVSDCPSEHVLTIRDVLTGKTKDVHTSRLARYRDGAVRVTTAMKRQAAHDRHGFVVQRIGGHRFVDNGAEVQLVWRGFEDEPEAGDGFNQYEDLHYALGVIPNLTKRYMRKLLNGSKTDRAEGTKLCVLARMRTADITGPRVGDL